MTLLVRLCSRRKMNLMPDLTFITPIGPLHTRLAQRAIESVQAQTVPCEHLTMVDTDRRGPGALRNELLRKVGTEFVAFLDADDWVEPTFAEETIREYRRIGGGKYIFTDWLDEHGHVITAPCYNPSDGPTVSKPGAKPYCGGTWHAITTLIPTAWAKETLFDETLPAVEDTDFYVRLCITMRCAHHLGRPLFHYSPDGSRGAAFRSSPDRPRVQRELSLRYGGQMGCCGEDPKTVPPIGERMPEDVLAMALWQGNRSEFGRATQRHYPRISRPRTAWVDPRDVAQSPTLWRIVEQPTPAPVDAPQGITSLVQMAELGLATRKQQGLYDPPLNEPPAPPVEAKPDVSRVIRLARNAQNSDPLFVFSDKDYPSYTDIRRLVELSGFRSVPMSKVDVFSRAPLVVVTPEPVGDRFRGVAARVICWQLEYAGDYTHNYDQFGGEVWASDKAWADAHGAKYVLMGSHPELAMNAQVKVDSQFDVTMLGYMTPRRQAIKDTLADLRWPADYPGHEIGREIVLTNTRLMLHVHQHDNAPYIAPQRIAIAAAYHMPVISETVADVGDLERFIVQKPYGELAIFAREAVNNTLWDGDLLFNYLCVERPFRRCVEEALKS